MAIYGRALGGGGGGGSDLLIYTGSAETPPADKPAGIYAVTATEPARVQFGMGFVAPNTWGAVSGVSLGPEVTDRTYLDGMTYNAKYSSEVVSLTQTDTVTATSSVVYTVGLRDGDVNQVYFTTVYNGVVYFSAGYCNKGTGGSSSGDLYVCKYDPSTNTGSAISTMRSYKGWAAPNVIISPHGALLYGGRIYYSNSGNNAGTPNTKFILLMDFSDESVQELNGKLNSASNCYECWGFYVNGMYYSSGGKNQYGSGASTAFYSFDEVTHTISQKGSYPIALNSVGAAVVNEEIILTAGGVNTSGDTVANCYIYNSLLNTFTATASYPTGTMGDDLYLVGGNIYKGANPSYVYTFTGTDNAGEPLEEGTLAIDIRTADNKATVLNTEKYVQTLPIYQVYLVGDAALLECTTFTRVLGGEWEQIDH